MIESNVSVFPNNVVNLICERMQVIDDDLQIFKRPLRASDPVQSVGVFPNLWTPDEESYEMSGLSPAEPTLQQYTVSVQALVRDGDEQRGLAVHSILSTLARRVLYRDTTLRVALAGLSISGLGATETLKRWKVRGQRYFNNDIEGQFLYLSTLEFWMETEIM